MSGYIARELVQGAVETSDLFDQYLLILNKSQEGSQNTYKVSAVAEVPNTERLGVADELGILRVIDLSDSTFRLFIIAQKEGRKPWKEQFHEINTSQAPEASGIAALQNTHIRSMTFEQQSGGDCLFFSLRYSPLILHTGWIGEPSSMSYEVYSFGKHSREVSSLTCSTNYLISGDEGGTLKCWNPDDKLLATETTSIWAIEGLHSAGVTSICIVREFVITGSSDNNINIIELSSGHLHRQLLIDSGSITSISIFGNNDFSIGNNKGGYVILDTQGEIIHLQPSFNISESVTCLSPSPLESSTYAVGFNTGALQFYSKEDYSLIKTFSTKGGEANPYVYVGVVSLGGVCSTVAVTLNGAVWVLPPSKIILEIEPVDKYITDNVDEIGSRSEQEHSNHQIPDNPIEIDESRHSQIAATPSREQQRQQHNHLVASPSHDETVWNVTLSTGNSQSENSTLQPTDDAMSVPSFSGDLIFKNRQKAAAMRDLPVQSETTSSLSKPSGDKGRDLEMFIQKIEEEEFDPQQFKKTNPTAYRKQLLQHPSKDPTDCPNNIPRYSGLPQLASDIGSEDGLGLVKQVPKQLSKNWIASQELKPPATLPTALQSDLISSDCVISSYNCPVPSQSFSLEILTQPYFEFQNHHSLLM